MNEVTNIHLGREAFTISVEAYAALQKYLHEIKRQVGEGGSEVIEEVEMRMAELLGERGISGEKVVLPKDVDYLKEQLGEPRDFKDEEADEAPPETHEPVGKHLFRNPRCGMVAGVAAGLAEYTGLPVIIFRFAFIALSFASGAGIIIYLLLWLLIPEAKSSSDVLKMQGRPVTVNSLKDLVERADVPGAAQRASHVMRGLVGMVVCAVTLFAGIGLMLLGIAGFAAATAASAYLVVHGLQLAGTVIFPIGGRQVLMVGCAFVALVILAVLLSVIGKAMISRKWSLPGWVLASIVGILVTALSVGGALGLDASTIVQHRYQAVRHTTTVSVAPFSTVKTNGSRVTSYQVPDSNYAVEIRTLGHVDTRLVKTSVVNGELTVDTTALPTARAECKDAQPGPHSLFTLCPYGPTDTEVTIHDPNFSTDLPPMPAKEPKPPLPPNEN